MSEENLKLYDNCMNDFIPELYDTQTRKLILVWLKTHLPDGYCDPSMLYFGERISVSLGFEKESLFWFKKLSEVIASEQNLSKGYFAAALAYLQIVSNQEERRSILEKLMKDLGEDKDISDFFAATGINKSDKQYNGFEITYLDNLIDHYQKKEKADNTLKVSSEFSAIIKNKELSQAELDFYLKYKNNFQKLQILSKIANEAYVNNENSKARLALEQMLIMDGDQPDVLRNLITIASELKDIEAYERYWKQYIRILFLRLFRHYNTDETWKEIISFYSKVASTMERECNKTQNESINILSRPGFLNHWIEANTALVWLTNILRDARGNSGNQADESAYLSLMRYWFSIFYPEFHPSVKAGKFNFEMTSAPLIAYLPEVEFDPAYNLVSKFYRWGSVLLSVKNEYNFEDLFAFAGVVARIPLTNLLVKLAEENKDGTTLDNKTIKQKIREYCSYIYQNKYNDFFETITEPDGKDTKKLKDWEGLYEYYFDEIIEVDLPEINLDIAYFLIQAQQITKSAEIAASAINSLNDKDFTKDSLYERYWKNAIYGVIDVIFKEDINLLYKSLEEKIPADPASASKSKLRTIFKFGASVNNEFETKLKDSLPQLLADHEKISLQIELMRKIIRIISSSISDDHYSVVKLKYETIAELEDIVFSLESRIDVDVALFQMNVYNCRRDYEKSKESLRKLPDFPEEIKKIKKDYLEHVELNCTMDKTMESVRNYVQNAQYSMAYKEINKLSDKPKELADFKSNITSQIYQAELQYNEQKRQQEEIDGYISRIQQCINYGSFAEAKQIADKIPNLGLMFKIKGQIEDIEKQYKNRNRY